MKVLVTYMTQSGNTRKVAEAIYGEIKTDKEILPLQEVESLQGYDLSFIGFPIVRFGPEEAVRTFLKQHTRGKRIVLFITHAAPEESPALSQWFAPAQEAASGAELVGLFNCQGALAQPVKEFMLNSSNPQLEEWAKHDTSQGQPDAKRLERARSFAREIMDRVKA